MSSIPRLAKTPPSSSEKTFDANLVLAQTKPRQDYKPAAPDAKAPALADYKSIGPANEVANDTIRFETHNGDKIIVLRSTCLLYTSPSPRD